MGVVACLLFGVIGAWISKSMLAAHTAGGLKLVLVIGVVSGLIGLGGIALGWGDFRSFNLYNVLLSIAASAVITFLLSRTQPKASLPE